MTSSVFPVVYIATIEFGLIINPKLISSDLKVYISELSATIGGLKNREEANKFLRIQLILVGWAGNLGLAPRFFKLHFKLARGVIPVVGDKDFIPERLENTTIYIKIQQQYSLRQNMKSSY